MVVYLSMGLLSLILGTIVGRLVVMGLTWMTLGRGFWILPNVLSEVSGPTRKWCRCIGRSLACDLPASSQHLLLAFIFNGKVLVLLCVMAAISMCAGARLLRCLQASLLLG